MLVTDCLWTPHKDVSAKNFKLAAKWNTTQRERGFTPAIPKQKQLATFTLNKTFICQEMLWLAELSAQVDMHYH